jgi:hypothetical protein
MDTSNSLAAAAAVVSPRKLELILNPEDGSLQTAPLLTVILATMDSLYRDLYNMAHGEVRVTSALQPTPGTDDYDEDQDAAAAVVASSATMNNESPQYLTGKSEKMNNLSFAQRRHELAWRLVSHSKAIQHVAALTAAAATSDLAISTDISTKALQYARTAWVQADEAQDAMYFFHAQLFPTRQAPHDVYGALDLRLLRYWPDLPSDLRLTVDRYETSDERRWSKREVSDRWQMAVRSKLLLGEVGWMKQPQHSSRLQTSTMSTSTSPLSSFQHYQHHSSSFHHYHQHSSSSVPWKVSLRGGIVRLTHGQPKTTIDAADGRSSKTLYPLEAILTILTTNTSNATSEGRNATATVTPPPDSEWTLISVEVHVQAKTGQSNHQLDTTNKQRFNMHRLCALAMAREEARARKARQRYEEKLIKLQQQEETTSDETIKSFSPISMTWQWPEECVARPLHAMFQVAHYFALSWQLEVLSAQAQALRKGVWGGIAGGMGVSAGSRSASVTQSSVMSSSSASTDAPTSSYGSSIVVTPVQFFEGRSILGIVSISFWTVDDRYGPPCMGDLHMLDEDDDRDNEGDDDAMDIDTKQRNGRRTSTNSSTGDSVSTVSRSINNPTVTNQLTLSIRAEPNVGIRVSLSGAESIMEFATVHPHIRSTIRELLEATSNPFSLSASEALLAATRLCAERKCYTMVQYLPPHLPSWISLQVDRGSIAVAAKIQYFVGGDTKTTQTNDPVILFRLACDSRTGAFVPTFARSTRLLQLLACNDFRAASDATALRAANMARFRRSSVSSMRSGASTLSSGRVVRDAFESLSRSMNVLGQRTGVGGTWKDHNQESSSLRFRSIQLACKDVKVSLMTCCGVAALYGLVAVTMDIATGVDPSPEMSGGKIDPSQADFVAAAKTVGADPSLSFLPTPPLTLLIDQKLVEHSSWTRDGDRVKESYTEQELFGVCCSVDDCNGVVLYGAEMRVKLESPSSVPTRIDFSMINFVTPPSNPRAYTNNTIEEPPTKRTKVDSTGGDEKDTSLKQLMDEVEDFAEMIALTIHMDKVVPDLPQ